MQSSQRATHDWPTSSVVVLPVAFSGDDATLVAAVREGRPGARAEFFNRYAGDVERLLTHILGFDRELSDILQETYTRAFASLDSLKDPTALKRWLLGVASRTAQKVLRTRARRAWLRYFTDDADESRHEPVTMGVDVQSVRAVRAVYAILEGLTVDQRVAFTLRFVDGMDVGEVAEALGVSLSTAKRRLRRAQTRFVARAQREPMLSDWLARGRQWQTL
jgi:RNA polymerase sigma-70 factor (ECF subfamily)